MIDEYKSTLKRYKDFKGVSGQREYWIFVFIGLAAIPYAVHLVIGLVPYSALGSLREIWSLIYRNFYSIYYLAVALPFIALQVRRFNDLGRSPYWLVVLIYPPVGIWVLLLLSASKGPFDIAQEAKLHATDTDDTTIVNVVEEAVYSSPKPTSKSNEAFTRLLVAILCIPVGGFVFFFVMTAIFSSMGLNQVSGWIAMFFIPIGCILGFGIGYLFLYKKVLSWFSK